MPTKQKQYPLCLPIASFKKKKVASHDILRPDVSLNTLFLPWQLSPFHKLNFHTRHSLHFSTYFSVSFNEQVVYVYAYCHALLIFCYIHYFILFTFDFKQLRIKAFSPKRIR